MHAKELETGHIYVFMSTTAGKKIIKIKSNNKLIIAAAAATNNNNKKLFTSENEI